MAAISLGIAQLATLPRYAFKFEERAARYNRAWHLCVKADERCRSEFWATEKRRQTRFAEARPTMTAVDVSMPWNTVIKESTDCLDFWLHELQEPALMYTAVRADEAPSWTHQQRELGKGNGGKRGDKGGDKEGSQGGHPRKKRGSYTTNQDGKPICWMFSKNGCTDTCPRAHQCPTCLGPHKRSDCPRNWAKGGQKKGAKGKSKGSDASY